MACPEWRKKSVLSLLAGQAIADHPLVRKLGFTGSTPVGKTIMKSCAVSNLKKASLELGGKSPLIIFGDFDLDRAVKTAMGAVFFNKGENCIAAGRIFVEETIYEEFLDKVVEETKKVNLELDETLHEMHDITQERDSKLDRIEKEG